MFAGIEVASDALKLLLEMTSRADPLELFTIPQAGAWLKVSRSTVYRMIDSGQIHPVTLGRFKRIPRVELERVVADALAGQNGDRDR